MVNSQLSIVNALDWLYSTQAFGIKLGLELLMRSGEVDAARLKPLQDEAAELRNIMSASAITARKNLKQEKHNFTNGQ